MRKGGHERGHCDKYRCSVGTGGHVVEFRRGVKVRRGILKVKSEGSSGRCQYIVVTFGGWIVLRYARRRARDSEAARLCRQKLEDSVENSVQTLQGVEQHEKGW